jgi:ABC-2 type transport system ATP-binding protein
MHKSETDHVIETDGLSRSFGKTMALHDLTLRVPRGGIYGFLGRNGSGKTTAIKMLAGLIRPTSGSVRVLGKVPFYFTPEDRQEVGYVSEKQILPGNFKVNGLASFCSQFYPRWDRELVSRLLGQFRIDPKKRIATLSQGMQRQVAFILALAQKPQLLILDEPAANLDVVARREFLDETLDLIREGGPTVFISSHILSDVERVADHIGILVDGRLVISEPLDELGDTIKKVRFYNFPGDGKDITLPETFRMVCAKGEVLIIARLRNPAVVEETAARTGAEYEIIDLPLEEIFIEVSRHSSP